MNKDWRDTRDWRKSSFSNDLSCVFVRGRLDAVRDSKDLGGPVLSVSREALAALVRTVSE